MSSFNATENATGNAYTSTTPPYLVTSSASATATSNLSEDNAKEIASNTAQQSANSVAQNDANIISQTLNLIPISVIGANSFLNITFVFKTSLGNQSEFNGLIVSAPEQTSDNSILLIITDKKIIYDITLEPILNSNHLATLNVIASNYGGSYGSITIDGVVYSSLTPASVLSCNRVSYIQLPMHRFIYKLKILTHVKYFCDIPITPRTTLDQIKKSIQNFEVIDKTIMSVNVVSETDNILSSFQGVRIAEQYTDDYLLDYISLDFTHASPTGSTMNIYPVSNKLTTTPNLFHHEGGPTKPGDVTEGLGDVGKPDGGGIGGGDNNNIVGDFRG